MRAALALVGLIALACAAEAGTGLVVEAVGWDGWCRAGVPAPLRVSIAHDGPSRAAELVLWDPRGRSRLRRSLTLTEGAARPLHVPFPADAPGRWAIGLRSGGRALVRADVVWRALPVDQPLLAVIGVPPPTLVAGLDRLGATLVRTVPERLPTDWTAWQAVDHVIVREPSLAQLAPSARRALQRWVLAGGHLVAMLSERPAQVAALLDPLLGWQLTGRVSADPAVFEAWLGAPWPGGEVRRVVGTPRPALAPIGALDRPLLGRWPRGEGLIDTVHFAPDRLPESAGVGRRLWALLLAPRPTAQGLAPLLGALTRPAADRRGLARPLARQLRRSGPSMGGGPLVWFGLLYATALLAAPWLARRAGKPAWAVPWLAGLAGVAGLAAVGLRDDALRAPPAREVYWLDGGPRWRIERWIGAIDDTPGAGVQLRLLDGAARLELSEAPAEQTLGSARRWRVPRPLRPPLCYGLTRPSLRPGPLLGRFHPSSDGGVGLRLVNPYSDPLGDAWLFTSRVVYRLGTLRPGMTARILARGRPLAAWLADHRGDGRDAFEALQLESLSGLRPGRGGREGPWDRTATLRRGDGLLFARLPARPSGLGGGVPTPRAIAGLLRAELVGEP